MLPVPCFTPFILSLQQSETNQNLQTAEVAENDANIGAKSAIKSMGADNPNTFSVQTGGYNSTISVEGGEAYILWVLITQIQSVCKLRVIMQPSMSREVRRKVYGC